MRLTANRNASGTTYYIIRSIVRERKRSSEVVERLGNEKEIMEKYHCNDAAAWAKARLEQLNAQEKEKVHKVLMPYRTDSLIPVDRQNSFQVGYLFLQKLYCALKILPSAKPSRLGMISNTILTPSCPGWSTSASCIPRQNALAGSNPKNCWNRHVLRCIRCTARSRCWPRSRISFKRRCTRTARNSSSERLACCTTTARTTSLSRRPSRA